MDTLDLKPKYAIGTVVYMPMTERTVEQLDCPDCLGTKVWAVQSPAGGEYTTDCPRCQQTYSFRDNMPSLKVERYVGKAQARTITGYEVNSRPHHGNAKIVYKASCGGSSYWTMNEPDVFENETDALAAAEIMAAEKNTATDEKPEVLKARKFSSLKLDDARFDEFKNGIWNSNYHAGNILQRVKTALEGEEGDEERDTAQIIEDLREAARWDFGYHVENLPLVPLVQAAMASEDGAVRAALDGLPQAMVDLLSGKTLAELKALGA